MAPPMTLLQRPVVQSTKQKSLAQGVEVVETQQKTVIGQPIKQKQSFELVQTLLLVSFTSICYLRYLLPDDCFEDRDYGAVKLDAHWPFNDFVSKPNPPQGVATSSPGTSETKRSRQVKIIPQGRSPKGDKVLSWLDTVFHCLDQGFLDSVQLSVILDPSKPSEVVESYSFSFGYKDIGKKQVEGVTIHDFEGHSVTVENGRRGLDNIIRYLIQMCQTLPELPEKRFLMMHLFYKDECPDGFVAPGCKQNYSEDMLVPDSSLWNMVEAPLGQMDAGFHKVSLKVMHLSPLADSKETEEDDVIIPAQLQYTKVLPRRSPRLAFPSKTSLSQDTTQAESQLARHDKPFVQQDVCGSSGEPAESQVSEATKKLASQLRSMNRAPSTSSDVIPTQPIGNNKLAQMKFEQTVPQLTQETKDRIVTERERYQQSQKEESRSGDRCECGFDGEEGDMIQCACCGQWQHQHCYALELSQAESIHVCYTCLLPENEKELLQKMRDMARLRRVLWCIRETSTLHTDGDFAKTLGCSVKAFQSAVAQLKKQRLLVLTPGSQKAGFKNKGLPRFLVLEDNMRKNFREHGMLHPLAAIEYYYQATQSRSTVDPKTQPPTQIDVKDHDSMFSTSEEDTDELLGQEKIDIPPSHVDSGSMLPPSTTNIRAKLGVQEPKTPVKRRREDGPDGTYKRMKSNLRSPLDASEES